MIKTVRPCFFLLLLTALLSTATDCSREMPVSENRGKNAILRLVSLSPSITREIIDLEAEDLLAGVTSYHPPLKRNVPIIGNLVNPNIEKIALIRPDIVLLSAEDSIVQRTAPLKGQGVRLVRFPRNSSFDAIADNYLRLAKLIGREEIAGKKLARYRRLLKERRVQSPVIKTALFLSGRPLVTVSRSSFIGRIIHDAGGINVYADCAVSYPVVTRESLMLRSPAVIIFVTAEKKSALARYLGEGKDYSANKRGRIAVVLPDIISYYTPADYVESVRILGALITHP